MKNLDEKDLRRIRLTEAAREKQFEGESGNFDVEEEALSAVSAECPICSDLALDPPPELPPMRSFPCHPLNWNGDK